MKKLLIPLLSFLLIGCSGVSTPNKSNQEPDEEFSEEEFAKSLENSKRLLLSCKNNTNTNYATYEAQYDEKGITITSYLYDSDLYARNIYDIGYDDNIEFIINVKNDSSSWVRDKTFHFLMNGAGKTYFQVARNGTSFGGNLDPNLHAVLGENYIYKFERLDKSETKFDGFKCEVFFAYDLLNTTYREAYGNLTICPAMRNTHVYREDTTWASYNKSGCKWNNASTFILIGKDGTFGDKLSLDFDALIFGDTLIDPSVWKTFDDDFKDQEVANIGVNNSDISYWMDELDNYSKCEANDIFVYLGSNDLLNGNDNIETDFDNLIIYLHATFATANINYLPIINNPNITSVMSKARRFNNAVKEKASSDNKLFYIDTSSMNNENSIRMGLFATDNTLNFLGSNLLSSIIFDALNIPMYDLPNGFGKNSMYASSTGYVKKGSDMIEGTGDRDQFLIYSDEPNVDANLSLSFNAIKAYNSDAYPKFGLVLIGDETTLFFYVDASNGLAKKNVGYVKGRQNSNWIWANSVEREVDILYTGSQYVKLGLVKTGNNIVLSVNDEEIFEVTNFFNENEKVTKGILTFNTNINIKY